MKKCVFAGTFDPVTKGHEEIIRKCTDLFDEVIVALCVNVNKNAMFSVDERLEFLRAVCAKYPSVKVVYHDGLLVELMRKENALYYVRGLRNGRDYDYENEINRINCDLMPQLTTLYVPSSEGNVQISSTVVRELLKFHEKVDKYVPSEIVGLIR